MMYGYARVSSTEQETALQRDALARAGVHAVFEEKRSAVKARPQLERLLGVLKPGDVVVVYKLDRVARSLRDLIRVLDAVDCAGAGFKSLTEPVDTESPAGQLMLHILGACAQFEWSLIRERSMAGQEAARRRGARIGRPRSMTESVERRLCSAVDRGATLTAAARRFDVHVSSAKRAVLRRRRGAGS